MKKNEFRLSNLPASHYIELFRKAHFYIVNKSSGNPPKAIEETEAVMRIGDEDDNMSFEVYTDLENDRVPEELAERAEQVINRIIPMDDAARMIPSDVDYNEELAYIQVTLSDIQFRYWATTVNTEWDVVYQFEEENKWVCCGIPVAGKPGIFHK